MSRADIGIVQTCYPKIYFACHTRHERAATSPYRVSARDSAILAHLDEKRPITPTELAQHLGIGKPTMSAALKRLRNLGYIDLSIAADDRRTTLLRLTATGYAAMRATSVLEAARVRRLLAALNKTERRRALEGLELLAAAAHRLMAKERTRG